MSNLPALGAGAALGAGLANRVGDRPAASLPGLGDGRPGASQLPANRTIGERQDSLRDRLEGGDGRFDRDQVRQDRQQNRDDRRQNLGQGRDDRLQNRDERQQNREQGGDDRLQNRDERQQNRQTDRDERQQNRQTNRDERQQNRQQNWDDVRNDWQQHRDDIREDWQQYRDDARNDWEGWFDDNYGRYDDWYAGYAPGYWGQWDYLWDSYPVAAAAGLTWWGANSLGYQFGYSDYSNPYYLESMPAYYTEPIVTVPVEQPIVNVTVPVEPAQQTTVVPASPPSGPSAADTKFDQARDAFLQGQYDAALKATDAALAQMPRDAVLHEFRSLVLFALQRYAESAATIHPVLDVGPGWDWKTLSSLYANADDYTRQLRALEAARTKDPKAADLRFLLGYHYITCGYADQALGEFRRALELRPNDSVARALIATLSPRDAQPAQAPAPGTAKAVPSDSVVGDWKAQGKEKTSYSMSLRKDGSFTWGFTRGARKQEVKGVHTVEGNVLAMEPDSGGVLLAEVTLKDPDTLHFKMIGGASDDPGLEFRRGSAQHGK
jgi:hypothetical protein